jgi:hypothetical protein
MGKGASETLVLLTLAYCEYALNNSSVFEWHVTDDPRSEQPEHKGQMHMWAEYELRCTEIKNWVLFGSANKVTGISSEDSTQTMAWPGFSTMTMPLCMVH